jgi:hypothetical protein
MLARSSYRSAQRERRSSTPTHNKVGEPIDFMLRGTQRFFDRQNAVHGRVKRRQPGLALLIGGVFAFD